jgi:serine/threonine protein phosphatase PrpC
LTSHVEDGAIADILSRHREPFAAALELIVAANAGGGSDNISTVVVFHE